MNIQLIVYFIGIFALGLFYANLKEATGGGFWFVLASIGYLLALRLIGYGITRLVRSQGQAKNK